VISHEGQLFGNRELGSDAHFSNGLNFSYPGYAETLTGFIDPSIQSNENLPNPNKTVFEWLNKKSSFSGKIAAFGAWEVFDGIFARERCGFPVSAGYEPLTLTPLTPELTLINELKTETVRVWPDEPFDPIPFHTAMEYLKLKRPRVIFLGLGETDDWAHAGSYAQYLEAAHLADRYIEELWDLIQSLPEYRGRTTLIVVPDHGRGHGTKWTDHGHDVLGSEETWMAFLGPDTPSLGERKNSRVVTESQIAATAASFLGEDYNAAVQRAAVPIDDVIGK
jgi:hypothetical protein